MAHTLLENIAENQDRFAAIHNERIGSSRIAAICGLNKYETPLQVWAKMTGKVGADPQNDAMWLGHEMQPVIGRLFVRRQNIPIETEDSVYYLPEKEWAIASPDFTLPDGGLLEAKNTGSWAREVWADGVPDAAHCQVQWQMGIVRAPYAYVAALCGGRVDDFFIHRIDFNEEVFNQLLERGERFMALVKSETPPDAMHGDDDLVSLLAGKLEDRAVNLSQDEYPALTQYQNLSAQKKGLMSEAAELKEQMEAIQNRLRLIGNGASVLRCGGLEMHIKLRTRAGYEAKASEWYEYKVKESSGAAHE